MAAATKAAAQRLDAASSLDARLAAGPDNLTIPELTAELKKRELPTTFAKADRGADGTIAKKAVFVARLAAALQAPPHPSQSAEGSSDSSPPPSLVSAEKRQADGEPSQASKRPRTSCT